ncbi:MAG TPA: MFS transporter [Terriglobales bacterium]|nr:MFS transporter [Terriglobales bacterium]
MAEPQTYTNRQRFHAVTASFLGWTMDAFDFFVVVFLFDALAAHFKVSKQAIVGTLAWTLLMRPVGAFLFGILADRYGRRGPLMANVIFFSLVEFACGLAPNYTTFLILRLLYGIGMGGEWGIGASLAMEMAPEKKRGLLSGILQNGYAIGYLLAAVSYWVAFPVWGWRGMFFLGGAPALLALYVRSKVPESEAWKLHRAPSFQAILKALMQHWKTVIYLVVFMTFMLCLSHGTQDMYPDFLKTVHGFSGGVVSSVVILGNIGAIVGGIFFGQLSQKLGRRHTLVAALVLAIGAIPLWAFGNSMGWLMFGAFLMQVGVQGAWGIVPVHLSELSPNAARGLVPGLTYQLGIVLAARTPLIEFQIKSRLGYQWAMTTFELATIVLLILIVLMGPEHHGRSFEVEGP